MQYSATLDLPVAISVGYAVGRRGAGVAYAEFSPAGDAAESLVRVSFRCRPLAGLQGRDVAYAALEAVGNELLRRGHRKVALRQGDAELVLDLERRRSVPSALTVPYVLLRCTLNRFREVNVTAVEDRAVRELTARARADASLGVAA